jgi:hypothetical protein
MADEVFLWGKQESNNHQGILYPGLLPLWALQDMVRPLETVCSNGLP